MSKEKTISKRLKTIEKFIEGLEWDERYNVYRKKRE